MAALAATVTGVPALPGPGQYLRLVCIPTGGTAPYTCAWSGLPPGVVAGAGGAASDPFRAGGNVTTEGTYAVTATVKDSTGATAVASAPVVVGAVAQTQTVAVVAISN